MTARPGETLEELRAAMAAHASADGLDRLDAVYALAERAHSGRLRLSGDPYVSHAVAVAVLLAQWDEPADVVLAGLLHDTVDDGASEQSLRTVAGPRTARLVVAVTRLNASDGPLTNRVLRRLALRRAFWRQVATIKVADRLHNARTWRWVDPRSAQAKAAETLDILWPVAAALGLAASSELATLSYSALGDATPRERSVVSRAAALLPAAERDRWSTEWEGDLAHLPPGRERIVFGLGLVWSALTIRADHLRRSTGTAPRRP